MAERDEGVLARWSRRKQAARRGRVDDGTPAEPPAPAAVAAPAEAKGEPPEPGAPPAELPDPDTLDDPASVRAFMRDGVPADLRRRALRRLWRLDPAYNRLDGLDDYMDDYTDQARVVKGLRTAYRVGRGFLEELKPAGDAGTGTEPATPAASVAGGAVDPAPGEAPPPGEAKAANPGPAAAGSRAGEPPRRRRLPRRS